VAAVRRHHGRVEVRLDVEERAGLLSIIETLSPHLGTAARTAPRAYDDPDLEDDYARLMRPEVEASRDADIEAVRDSLRGEGERRELDDAQALSWARALNHLRLVAGALLGIEADGWDDEIDPSLVESTEFTMLMALGWMQERIVQSLDA
jgi:hypothetical protein